MLISMNIAEPFKELVDNINDCKAFSGHCEITNARSSRFIEDIGNDRFHISLPYCGDSIKCQVILNADQPDVPPDFIFEEGFLSSDTFTAEDLQKNVPSLLKWNPQRKTSLKAILFEFITWHKANELNCLRELSQAIFEEYTKIKDVAGENAVEVSCSSSIVLLVALPIKYKQIHLLEHLGGSPFESALKITYKKMKKENTVYELFLPPTLDKFFSEVPKDYRLKNFPPIPEDAEILNRLKIIIDFINNKLLEAFQVVLLRETFMTTCLSLGEKAIIEYDAKSLKKAAFLFETKEKDFAFIVRLVLPDSFPQGLPQLTFHSLHKGRMGMAHKYQVNDFPYSSVWEPADIAKSFFKTIKTHIPKFIDAITE